MASARKEWVYVMSNPSMPGRVKVGQSGTRHPSERAAELFNTGVPTPFVIEYEALIEGAAIDIERAAHMQLVGVRDVGREFFRCKPSVAVHAVQMAAGTQLIHEDHKGRAREKQVVLLRRAEAERLQREAERKIAVAKELAAKQQAAAHERESIIAKISENA